MSIKRELLSKTKLEFYNEIKKYQQTLKPTKELEGYAASSIVGEKNYPYLSIHNIQTEDKKAGYKNTAEIVKKDYSDIFKFKAKNILGTTNKEHIRKVDDKIKKEIEDIYKAKNDPNFTTEFEKELKFDKVLVNKVSGIMGSKNPLQKLQTNENAQTSKQVEKYTQEDIKSKEAIISLYEKGTNEHQIINLLALGSFGINMNKKLVPTRWAITAYDKCIENYLHQKLTQFKIINEFQIFQSYNKGNTFLIILIPNNQSFENIEWFGQKLCDYSSFENKLDKEEPETAGGFYASKVAVSEHLMEIKKQASILCIRLIEDYDLPLGVVLVRESIRDAMKNKIFSCSNEKEMIEFLHTKNKVFEKLYLESRTLRENKNQKKLREFF